MSYIVTARKWRPQFFRDVISQKHVTETLKNAIKSGRVGHAYLFSGPRGVGKTTVARIFAKALNCIHGPAEEPCNVCENCVSIQSGASMDVQELDGASHNSVDDARDLISNIGYHSTQCRYKMYIIDEVHMLSREAFNALLKTLEEPPSNVIFVFATTEPHKIPVTILSRCQRFDFHRLSVHEIAGKIRTIAEAESIGIDDSSVMLIARRATGAMRDAESILEQLRASRGTDITIGDVTEVLGIADREIFFRIVERCHEQDTAGVLGLFTAYYDGGGDLKEFVEGLLGHLRDMLYSRFEGGLDQITLSDDMRLRIREQSEWFHQGDLVRMIQVVTDTESSLAYAVIPTLRIEMALVRMASMETTVQLKSLFDMLGGAKAAGQPAGVPPVPTARASSAYGEKPSAKSSGFDAAEAAGDSEVPEYTMDPGYSDDEEPECLSVEPAIGSIRSSWRAITDRIGSVKPGVSPSLAVSEPESFDNGKLTLAFESGHEFHRKTVESNASALEEIFGAIVGTPVKIACYVRHADSKKKVTEVDDLIKREPVVGDILRRFDGEINGSWRE
ncbi:DNA polymerase III subunit gamma/tau [bacterium]|nr:DNA polymerase III subunit gamma/tau [bacterium]